SRVERSMSGWGYLQAHAASACRAGGAFCDEFDAGEFERRHNLGQAVHDTAHIAATGLHTLDRWHGSPRQLGQGLLVDAEQGAGGAHLRACDHGSCPERDKQYLEYVNRYVKHQPRCLQSSSGEQMMRTPRETILVALHARLSALP